jgi:2-keto-4-pentenoate hydratase
MTDTQKIAREMLEAYDRGNAASSIAQREPDFDANAAYDVAAEIVKLRHSRGERSVGRKIGFTNRNIWPQYGATSPIWAHVYDRTLSYATDNRATVSLVHATSPRIEPEIAFRLAAPVPAGSRDAAQILQSIEWLAPAFEIVDCHFADWKFNSAESIADHGLHWRLIIGTPVRIAGLDRTQLAQDLANCKVELSCNGAVRERGIGSNALDHPALALAFLAEILAKQPRFDALKAGEIITTGTLTAALPVQVGETWTSAISGLHVSPLSITFTLP